jgi:hypothetical protein
VFASPGSVASTNAAPVDAASPGAGDAVDVALCSGSTHQHQRLRVGWKLTRLSPGTQDVIELGGVRAVAPAVTNVPPQPATPADQIHVRRSEGKLVGFQIGHVDPESLYRRTEATWHEAGEPTALMAFHFEENRIEVALVGQLGRAPNFAPKRAENPLDNEPADVNSDGAQLHWRSAVTGQWNSVLAVPAGKSVRLTLINGSLDRLTAKYIVLPDGFIIRFRLPWPDTLREFVVDACINECPPDRERRRGQLVMSGARGAFAYLLGARQSDAHAFHLVLPPVTP